MAVSYSQKKTPQEPSESGSCGERRSKGTERMPGEQPGAVKWTLLRREGRDADVERAVWLIICTVLVLYILSINVR